MEMKTMRNKWLVLGLLALSVSVVNLHSAEAGNIDTYKNLLMRNTYTIKYENITPAPRATNKDKVALYGYSGLAVDKADYLLNKQVSGIITANGKDKYEEVGDTIFKMCRLNKNGEDYIFTKYTKNDKWNFFGNKKGKVVAQKANVLASIVDGASYGDQDMSRVLNAILPASMKSPDMPSFEYVTSGWLNNGLNYEDYQSSHDGMLEAIRYYFNGYNLVKIAYARSYKGADGGVDGHKCIIKISEFSPTPDETLLKLPEGLADVTKRKNEEDAEK